MLEMIQQDGFKSLIKSIKSLSYGIVIAKDEETEALLTRTDKQYNLTIPGRSSVSRWPRSRIKSDEEAVKIAQKVIDNYVLTKK